METDDPRRQPGATDEGPDRGEPGAEGGHSDATDALPGAPAQDDSPLGDTDQHSGADA
jgi:hypothetical protein